MNSRGEGLDTAFDLVDGFIQKVGLSGKNAIHIRLLAEEMLGMVKAITGNFNALFWAEGDDKECQLHLSADVDMDADKRKELIEASTSGKNEAAKGIMGRIREVVEVWMENYEDIGKIQMQYGIDPINYSMMGVDNQTMSQAVLTWSLKQYRDDVSGAVDVEELTEDVRDDLEKSIVANIADDVKVGIMNDKLQMTIFKKF